MFAHLTAFALFVTAATAPPAAPQPSAVTAPAAASAPVSLAGDETIPVLPAVTVIEQRGFDPETGAGSSIQVAESRGRLQDAGDLLGHAPGVTVRKSGGWYQGVSIRGSAPNQAQLFINGVPLPSSLGSALSPAIFPLDALSRIDVYRGALPARFVRSPLTGAIDVVTHDPHAARATVRFGAGSFGRREAAAQVPFSIDRSSLIVGGAFGTAANDFAFRNDNGTFHDRADDFEATRDNNDADQASTFLVGQTQAGALTVRGHALTSGVNQGVPGFAFNQSERVRLDTRVFAAATEVLVAHEQGEFGLSVFGGHLRDRFRDPRGEMQAAKTNTLNAANQAGVRLSDSLEWGDWRPEAALEVESLQFHADRAGQTLPAYRRHRAALSLGTQAKAGRLTWRTGAQLEFDALRADNTEALGASQGAAERQAWLPAVHAGAAYFLHPALRLLVNAGTGYRVPSAQEQFGDRGTQLGNPELRPERAVFGDGGFQWERKARRTAWLLDVRYFAQRMREIIGVYQSTPQTVKALNFDSALATGYEASGSLSVGAARAGVNVGYATVVNTGSVEAYWGKQLPGRPIWEGGADLALATRYVEPFYTLDAMGEYFLDPVNSATRKIDSRFYHAGGFAVKPHRQARITASVENAFDVRSVDYVGFPLPGRSFGLVLQLTSL